MLVGAGGAGLRVRADNRLGRAPGPETAVGEAAALAWNDQVLVVSELGIGKLPIKTK